jgi:hypothetical protein
MTMLLPAREWGQVQRLLDQEMFCLGRDAAREEGNLLVAHGLVRTPAPPGSTSSSRYRCVLPDGGQLGLCSFGIYLREAGGGPALFLDRQPMRVRLTPSPLEAVLGVRELPADAQPPRDVEAQGHARRLLGGVLSWVARYEAWVQETLGPDYRTACLARLGRRPRVAPGDVVPTAATLARLCLEGHGVAAPSLG